LSQQHKILKHSLFINYLTTEEPPVIIKEVQINQQSLYVTGGDERESLGWSVYGSGKGEGGWGLLQALELRFVDIGQTVLRGRSAHDSITLKNVKSSVSLTHKIWTQHKS